MYIERQGFGLGSRDPCSRLGTSSLFCDQNTSHETWDGTHQRSDDSDEHAPSLRLFSRVDATFSTTSAYDILFAPILCNFE